MAPVYFDLGGLILTVFLLIVAAVLGLAYWIGRRRGVIAALVVGGAVLLGGGVVGVAATDD